MAALLNYLAWVALIHCHFGGEGFAILRKATPDRCAAMDCLKNRRIFTSKWITDAVIPLKPTLSPEFCKVRHIATSLCMVLRRV